ncbi:MAG TPA: alpha/beta hydrolase [Burkholderiales bacterium]|nr:alpha/beta hydrolase [Burkholderiales bacterium]
MAGIDLEVHDQGKGEPLFFLHSAQGFDPRHEVVPLLEKKHRLIAPSHPGFGKSSLPDWLDSVDDIAHVYLELLDHLKLKTVQLVGCSIGGWIAAEMATKAPERFPRLVMVGAVGVKTGPVDKLDIPDIFALAPEKVDELLFADPARMKMDPSKMTDEEIGIRVRNRETLALITWEPWMHNPKLKHRLQRAAMPALFMRGEKDGLVSARYMEAYAKLLPNARTVTIPGAGHAPQIEQPKAFAEALFRFIEGK